MRQHRTKFYMDGFVKVEYCAECGAEGDELRLECVGSLESDTLKENIKNIWLGVDNLKLAH